MVEKATEREKLIAAWALASERLGIRVVSPFEFNGSLGSHECIAFLPDFGSSKGMLVQATYPPMFATDDALVTDAGKVGYYVSFINANSYATFDIQIFQEALKDWGFYGSPTIQPAWIDNSGEHR
jgi:hypothetical protein